MSRIVFLDCGTHEGQGLAELAPLLHQGCEVHCFEPNPAIVLNVDDLKMLAEAGGMTPSSLTTHQAAIYDRDGTIEFASMGGYPRGTWNGRGQSSSITGYKDTAEAIEKNKVPCVNLVTFIRSLQLEEWDQVHIKLDIEGAEYATLKHLLSDGADVIPFIKRMWVEWHGRYFVSESWERNKGDRDLAAALTELGVEMHVWR